MSRLYMILGVLAVIGTLTGAAYLKGRADGRWAERVVQLKAIQNLNKQLDAKAIELKNLEAARLKQMRVLENRVEELGRLADEDPHADRPAIGVGSVQRLNTLAGD